MTTDERDVPELDNGYADLPQQEEHYRPPARFGNVPVARTPLGWDRRNPGFRNHYPVVNLPTQIVDRVSFGAPELEPNRLIWGDCLHVMRQLPSESIDLIYIDPPFFSNRNYNVIWGDANEKRSFSDIWEGGAGRLPRLAERSPLRDEAPAQEDRLHLHSLTGTPATTSKLRWTRYLVMTGFLNEIVWHYRSFHGNVRRYYARKHDTILVYVRSDRWTFNRQFDGNNESTIDFQRWNEYLADDYKILGSNMPMQDTRFVRFYRRWVRQNNREPDPDDIVYEVKGQSMDTVWDIKPVDPKDREERIGYPTQKPESLLERIVLASSDEGDIVADFFIGGGTTAAVAERLGRRWVACDQSRVATAVTAERLKAQAMTRGLEDRPTPDFTIEQWGIYEAERLSEMPPEKFRRFVLDCYDARIASNDDGIHGYKGAHARVPVWVGVPSLKAPITVEEVNAFAQAIGNLPRYSGDEGLRDGVMLAWGFAPDAVEAAQELRERGAADIAFVRLEQVRIDSPAFRQHIASQSTERGDYSQFLTFVQPPDVSFAHRRLKPLHYGFDATDTQTYNPDAKIINVQWDFNYDGRTFHAERRPWAERASLTAQHTFPRVGTFTVACKAQDDKGGEGMRSARVEAN